MSLSEIQYPESEDDVARIVSQAHAAGLPIEVRGGGTKIGLGRPSQSASVLSLAKLTGITNYDPSELVMAARAGTPLHEIEAALAANNQMLTFEPMDHRPLLGVDGEPTIGGVFAGNISGPRRIQAGAARDNLLGVRFVNGSGEIVKSGGRVMKNVTGLDLVKLLAGPWGTLGVLCEVIFKVLPKPETAVTIAVSGLNDAEAAEAMAAAMAMSVEVSGAAHLPLSVAYRFGDILKGEATTVLRLEGLTPSVDVRTERLVVEMRRRGEVSVLDAEATRDLWRDIRDVKPFAVQRTKPVWRVSVAPSAGHQLVAALRLKTGVDAFYDWQGGLVWLQMEAEPEADLVRQYIKALGGGHATLVRADAATRAAVPVFEPQPRALDALSRRIKDQFDPGGILNPGRMTASM
ncbi:MAG: glycolate oxidase subunit GlcE [Hoeflea sp.]|uniref:glycolate oxidase subunit GlcE n=1 Tax=Hoeflea sp. TaxID=1940281 RepID=UPI001E05B3A2|nr:glycolate oxidase subunit GlcE [Hoeflea sp.]MBU4529149.1 glycolate oxidase subunit GlcE [Alphaproteobacteria bacterium]MBU4543554.1 glycolate oxidase subunit GlcE [Alphaproteobacteria bacterium]MBU4549179.1 glycolate oxidase subunit GlcE [Alphaproteobacteria bacterium]MBV1725314.1 glycolate oxidase subunit GlcE [Hoeflea sp.]MBV1785275.1 glycolate oxidase subunit GlcE [Hoeflea sp.]